MSTNTTHSSSDNRSPLDVARAIAGRFMKIRHANPDYMRSVGMSGILELYGVTKEQRYLDCYLADMDKRGPKFDWRLCQITGDRQWIADAEEYGEKFLADPRRDREGALLDPRGRYTVDVFSGQFSIPLVLGHLLRDHRYFDEAARLLEINRSYMEEPHTGIWYSRWGHCLHPNRNNPGLWARGNGWLIAVWGRIMHLWDPSHGACASTLKYWQQYCRSIAAFQTDSGLFRQLLNRPDCFEEASGTGLFCTGFSQGVLHGTLPAELGPVAYRAFCGLRGLVDAEGNIHNVSTYAGGYNYERQYYSTARFNEPHGDGTVMSGCVALHELMREKPLPTIAKPTVAPVIVTTAVPGLLSTEPPIWRSPDQAAPSVLKRVLELREVPEQDPFGHTILGLLHWFDYAKDKQCLDAASKLLDRSRSKLSPLVWWNLACELDKRVGSKASDGLRAFVDETLKSAVRDRKGVFMDEHGGYSIETLNRWLPLLAKTGSLTGETRYFDEGCTQFLGHQRWLEDPLTYFWHSAYGRGAHPRRVTPGLWALGNAYVLAAAVHLLEHLPRNHDRYTDVVRTARCFVDKFHEYLPVGQGWRQILDDLRSFPCNAASPLITYGCARTILNGWAEPEYYAVVSGGAFHIGERVDAEGNYQFASRPEGGLDTIEAYEQHRLHNDPAALGLILSGLAYGALCMKANIDPDARDKQLGAR